jgi:hypothetical protein
MTSTKAKKTGIGLVSMGGAIAAFLLLILVFSPTLVLEVWDVKEGRLLLSLPVERGNPFVLRYTHSTAKTIVEEHFHIAGVNDIVLRQMVYSSGGAGIPDSPPPGAQFKISSDGRFMIEGLNRRFSALSNIRVAYFYPFLLDCNGREHSLSGIAKGRLINIYVRDGKSIGSALRAFFGENQG